MHELGSFRLSTLCPTSLIYQLNPIYELARKGPPLNMLAIDILKWPGMNQAFLFSFFLTLALIGLIIVVGMRRPADRKATWGEAIFGATYVFAVMFIAFGVVPHQFIDHADKNLGWRKDNVIYGPFDILKPQSFGGQFPFDVSYEAIRDTIVVVIHVFYFVIMGLIFAWWQKRGTVKTKEVETSSYGRPLARKA